MACLIIGENLSYYIIFGVVIILFGVGLAFKPRKHKNKKQKLAVN
jgi:hypothetical protein